MLHRPLIISITLFLVFASHAARADETIVRAQSVDTVMLGGAALSGSSGIVRVNQAAGVGNLQSNVAIIRIGSVSDARLDAVVSQSIDRASNVGGLRSHGRVVISSSALAGVRGLTQINQSAGNGNTSSNVFSLTVQP